MHALLVLQLMPALDATVSTPSPLAATMLARPPFAPIVDLSRVVGGWGALAAALAAVVLVLLPTLSEWCRRRSVWLSAPERLADDPPEAPGPRVAGVVLAAFAGVLSLAGDGRWQDPLTAWIAAIAVFTAVHTRWDVVRAWLAVALLATGVVAAARAWLPPFGLNTHFALALSALYFLWLSRFWNQQLLPIPAPPDAPPVERDGQPWTTTGRLVPIVRRAAYLALFAAAATLLGQLFDPLGSAAAPGVALTALLYLVAALRCTGSPRRRDGALAAAAGVAALVCVVLSAWVGIAARP